MKLLTSAFLYFNKIKIVHSVPGRLRLYVPGLNKIPKEMQKYDFYTTELIEMEKGVKSVEYSYVTSKILIIYDKDLTDEKKILAWINKVFKIVVENKALYENMSEKEIEKNLDKFYEMLKEKLLK